MSFEVPGIYAAPAWDGPTPWGFLCSCLSPHWPPHQESPHSQQPPFSTYYAEYSATVIAEATKTEGKQCLLAGSFSSTGLPSGMESILAIASLLRIACLHGCFISPSPSLTSSTLVAEEAMPFCPPLPDFELVESTVLFVLCFGRFTCFHGRSHLALRRGCVCAKWMASSQVPRVAKARNPAERWEGVRHIPSFLHQLFHYFTPFTTEGSSFGLTWSHHSLSDRW